MEIKILNLNKVRKTLPNLVELKVKGLTRAEMEKDKKEWNKMSDIDGIYRDYGDYYIVKTTDNDYGYYLLIYNVECVRIKDEITETTKKFRELENKYKNDFKRISEMTEINENEKVALKNTELRKWLQERLEFMKKYKNELEIEEYVNNGLTEIWTYNKDDGELLLIIDNRYELNHFKDDIDLLYKDLFEFLQSL